MIQISQTDSLLVQKSSDSSLYVQNNSIEQALADSLQYSALSDSTMQIPVVSGMQGEPLPYKMESDEAVVGAITLCFVLILLALQRGSCSIIPYLKEAVTLRKRSSFLEEKVSLSSVSATSLCFSTILASGVCLYRFYSESLLGGDVNHLFVLTVYILAR